MAVRLAGADAIAAFDRVWSSGDAVLPLDPAMSDDAARTAATALGAAALIDHAGRHGLDGGAPVDHGTALVVRTSGSTGPPRGVVLGHAALRAGVDASLHRLDAETGDRWLCVLGLHHVAGLLGVLRARASGTEAVIHPGFDVARIAAEPGVSHVALVPTMLHRLLAAGVDVARFTRILLGGAAAPPELLERARAAGATVVTTYGMTETAGGCVYDGRPLDGVAVAVDADRRVLVRGPVLADGYRTTRSTQPLTDTDGWFRTSDLGRFVAGRLKVTGRADDVIVSGGVNVSAGALSSLLRRHPLVADAAVVGVDDDEWGQRALAYVVPADAARPPSLEGLRAFVREHGDPVTAPKQVRLVTRLPRTALGKVDRGALHSGLPAVQEAPSDD